MSIVYDETTEVINGMVHRAHWLACARGWYEGADKTDPHQIASRLALIHSEVSEALEAVRDRDMELRYEDMSDPFAPIIVELKKPEGFPAELADIVIRVFDLAGWLEIDLGTAIAKKHEYNAMRPHRHGGKAL